MNPKTIPLVCLASLLAFGAAPWLAAAERTLISLNGEWQIAEGSMDQAPARFERRVPVPGLIDMASPAFAEVGTTNSTKLREAFWYRRTFKVEGQVPAVAMLKIQKAAYGSKVFLNGKLVGEHLPSFTPGYFDVRSALKGSGAENELLVRVGAFRTALPPGIPDGWDFEKLKYIPGIFDSVELILSGLPHIVRVQTAPDITNKTVRVQALIRHDETGGEGTVHFTVREARSRRVVATGASGRIPLPSGRLVEARLAIADCRLWSPEDPFLYELETSTGADTLRVRFGMREFHFDPVTRRAILNGRPHFLRGSNVTLYRFFEDAERGDRPWREEWVRRLHRRFKEMHWDTLRYCIGFPPEIWYDIADEEGFLIQDEYPLWHLSGERLKETWPPKLTSEQLAREYAEWMQERWNHPSVVIWDAQNETVTAETGKAIQEVRKLDLSNRPWDNGWAAPQAPGDCYESHPYMASNPNFRLADVAGMSGVPRSNPAPNTTSSAIVINEYGWLWLNRDGTPTTLTRQIYANLLGTNATPAQRQHLYARYLAAKTEFWRAHRACAGVLHFCGLGYSRPEGQTSDHFTDLERLTFEPEFFDQVRDAFAPVGLMIDQWDEELPSGQQRQIPVVVINDLYETWKGTVRFRILKAAQILQETSQPRAVAGLGKEQLVFPCTVPSEPGHYQLEAALIAAGAKPVHSRRDFQVLSAAERESRHGLATGKLVKASSELTHDGLFYPATNAVDAARSTRWSSEFSDPQWLSVDLGESKEVSRVELMWENAYAKSYVIQVSNGGSQWHDVYTTDKGSGKTETIRFSPTSARWVRFYGTKRATPFGYSLWELKVFKQ